MHPIGIDLGTTRSAVSKWTSRHGFTGSEPYNIQSEEQFTLPSKVFVEIDEDTGERKFIFGRIAESKGMILPDQYIQAVKRHMDQDDYSYHILGQKYGPVDISAEILKYLLQTAGNVEGAEDVPAGIVVSVPYYFKEVQKANTIKAAQKAIHDLYGNCNLHADLDNLFLALIEEPVAAGLDYAFTRDLKIAKETVLVFDLGGGTFDLTLFMLNQQRANAEFEVLAVEGDGWLGGEDFDHSFLKWIFEEAGIDLNELDERERGKALKIIQPSVNKVKHALSSLKETEVYIPNLLIDGKIQKIALNVTRSDFEACITGERGDRRDYYHLVSSKIDNLLAKANISPDEIGSVLLVGGSSRIPIFHELITNTFSSAEKRYGNDISLAAAKGAAIYAAYLLDEQSEKKGMQRNYLEKWDRITIVKKEKGGLDEMINKRIGVYRDKVRYFKREGGRKDFENLRKVRTEFDRWKSYLITLVRTFDDLYYQFNQTIEERSLDIKRATHTINFRIDLRNREGNIDALRELLRETESLLEQSDFKDRLPDNLLTLTGVNVSVNRELDYFIEGEIPSGDMLVLEKKRLYTLLVISKVLLKTKEELSRVIAYVLESEGVIYRDLKYFDPDSLVEGISSKQEAPFHNILQQTDIYLEENYKTTRSAEEITDKLKKRYFSFLRATLFKACNALHVEYLNPSLKPDSPELSATIKKWHDLYKELQDLILDYLNQYFDITRIDCKRGDKYDENLHEINDEEPDQTLGNGKVKRVESSGFIVKIPEGEDWVIKPVEIVIVNND